MKNVELVVWIVLLIDSISCNLIAWSGHQGWYMRHFRVISRNFPATRGWTTYYLILVLWMGVMLYSSGVLGF